ncbi:hypothetical protein CIW49_30505 [Mycolicibacterium sp. P1-18]|uniref:hypothetical protein n=1 Tax=Mycolicibacterium sp. P1-18 TaxID=2024615 RepID=UPI0011F38402|nr:hypothetical protein [Mycolicibacterium sp. P1-18]KAA0091416.1 hypothetical protein CIW49_30505 [Mycolicibacterium sp. P1-18]
MTTTRQHIEDLDVDRWATLTRRAAADAVATAERLGMQPRPETVALARMTERDLVEHRERTGSPVPRRSLAMQVVEADHLRSAAEEHARIAQQGRLDAEAAASLARAEAEESARVAAAAGERVRAVEADAARQDAERRAERAADQKATLQARADVDRSRAEAAAEAAAADERVRAAEQRAVERSAERTTERAAGEQTVQLLHAEIEMARADAAAEVAAAEERARAAEARAAERSAERAAERATAEEAVQQVRRELEKVRADAAAEVAAARGQAAADVAAAHEAAAAEIAAAQKAAAADVARWEGHALDMERWARAEVATHLLTIPIPPFEVRSRAGSVESTIDTLYQIDHVLEVALGGGKSSFVPDRDFTLNLILKVQEQAEEVPRDLAALSTRYADEAQVAAAAGYAVAAGDAFRALLQRVDAAVTRLGTRFRSPDAEIIEGVTAMLADLRAKGLY